MKNYRQKRLLEMSGIRHRSDLITEGDDLFGDDSGLPDGVTNVFFKLALVTRKVYANTAAAHYHRFSLLDLDV